MRKVIALVCLGLSGFVLILAALAKWYAYPALAKVPIDQTSVSHSVGKDMTFFSIADRKQEVSDLTTEVRVVGDVSASRRAGDDVAVWDKSSMTTDDRGRAISVSTQKIAFDRYTGEAVHCCHTRDGKIQRTYSGLLVKLPFNAQKKSYRWWDTTVNKAMPMKYVGQTTIRGLRTLHYRVTIPRTALASIDVPDKLVGAPGTGMATAQQYYSSVSDYYAEPETGALIQVVSQPNQTIEYHGRTAMIATRGTSRFPDSDVRSNVDKWSSKGAQLHVLRAIVPLGGLILGLLLLLVGALLLALGRPRERTVPTVEPEYQPA